MKSVLKGSFLEKFPFEIIHVEEGDIIRIDRNGNLDKSNFVPDCFDYYGRYWNYYGNSSNDGYLHSICNTFGITQEELELLYDMGYCDEEIEIMLNDIVAYESFERGFRFGARMVMEIMKPL